MQAVLSKPLSISSTKTIRFGRTAIKQREGTAKPPGLLRTLPCFQDLTPAELKALEQVARIRRYHQGELITVEGERYRELGIVISGHVQVSLTSPSGREFVVGVVAPGDSFRNASVAEGKATKAMAVALEPTVAAYVAWDDFCGLAYRYPAVALAMFSPLFTRITSLHHVVADLALRNVNARVAGVLLAYPAQDLLAQGPQRSTVRVSQQQLAALVGTTRGVIARSLAELRRTRAIKQRRGAIEVIDRKTLLASVEKGWK